VAVDQSIVEALDLDALELPAEPRVLRLHAEDWEDPDGDPALRIYVVIPDDTDVEATPRGATGILKLAIHDRLIEIGETRFPYMTILLESEAAEMFGAGTCTKT
jgi:hypothetical protein